MDTKKSNFIPRGLLWGKAMKFAIEGEAEFSPFGRHKFNIIGVTLLEIMLVLAIAAMIIVMSVRYYQSASSNQQANTLLEEIQAITSIAEGIAQGANSYAGVSSAIVASMMPNKSLNTPWGTALSVTGGNTSSYSVTGSSIPDAVCAQIPPRLQTNAKFTGVSCSGGNLSYTYDSTK